MDILVLYGSPHKSGTTAALAEAFLAGLSDEGHRIETVYLAQRRILPCSGCGYCRTHDGACVHQDDMQSLYKPLLETEVIVFVSPLYYFDFSAQMKLFIDRFYAVNNRLREQPWKKCVLLAAGADTDNWAMDGIRTHYEAMLRYLGWTSLGAVYAYGCGTKEMLTETAYPAEATAIAQQL